MEIKNESDFNAKTVRALRESLGMSQAQFWGAVCVSTARGSAYEIERNKIPAPVKRLLWLHYFAGIDTSAAESQPKTRAASKTRKLLEGAKASIETALKELP